ncbi:carbohydrate-binding module family 50 protein [Patellaria atrata CBS 101060]|uniref:Carbohydrate-binding module family 50 protein n=1 Tax=Patellaria atrata CBS 101060 TaxID=1346257 RepID=A0A9P4S7B1_9PEZI|nr:carbohydrate-binding module family 50 protein [Patellaria atrata CBS 101060]
MLYTPLIVAAATFSSFTLGATLSRRHGHAAYHESLHVHSFEERATDTYKVYGGTGDILNGWPDLPLWWKTYEEMFTANKPLMKASCKNIWNLPNNSDAEITAIFQSITTAAKAAGMDRRFVLAVIMQESKGCVRAPTTNNGVRNPGLMQSHNGVGTCNDKNKVTNPCPTATILQMLMDGANGTKSGEGLRQCVARSGATDISRFYKAARLYNSGSIDPSKNLGKGIATHCYASDIANRLTGWVNAKSGCNENTIGNNNGVVVKPTTTSKPTPTPTPTSKSSTTSKPTTTTKPTSTSAKPTSTTSTAAPSPTAPGVVSNCKKFYTVASGNTCATIQSQFSVTLAQLRQWNTEILPDCTNLWLGYQYCVGV